MLSVDWSPDGKRLALAGDSGYAPDIYVMDADGGNLRNLTHGRAVDGYQPDWSPNGRRIVFTQWRGDDSSAELYVVDADGRSPVRLTRNTVDDSSPTWSGNGRRIAFVRTSEHPLSSTSEIYVMNADGKRVRRLTRNRLPELTPAWQPARRR